MRSQYYTFKPKTIVLRKSGKTYGEIQKIIGKSIPKSTLSYWCHNLPLPLDYQRKIKDYNKFNLNKARKIALAVNRVKREKYLSGIRDRNAKFFGNINLKTEKLALAMLYLGEGSKWKSHRGLMLGSSDSDIIKIYLKLLKNLYNISTKQLRCRVLYRADQNINSLQRFWSKITKIPFKNFYKTKPDPRTVGKKTLRQDYRGVCVISGGGTEVQLELEMIPKIVFLGP